MINTNIIKSFVSRTAGRSGLILQKNSPEILVAVGIVGIVTSAVMACRATLKAEDVINEARENLEYIREAKDLVNNEESSLKDSKGGKIIYSERDYQKDLVITYAKTGFEFAKLYGPAIIVGVASISCVLGAHGIMKKRNIALMAAYKAVEQSFSDYRKRVVEEYGDEKDRCYRTGIRQETATVVKVDENGKKIKSKETIEICDPNGISQYARFFDEGSAQWSKTPEYNLTFLKCQQNFANDLLHARGHVFLNEIYDMIGIPRTQAGAVVGWVRDEGDGFIDFGIFDGDSTRVRDFVNGYERNILLDFNVSGVIYDLI